MKIEVTGCELYSKNGKFPAGSIVDVEDAEAGRLIKLGVAKKPGGAPAANPQTPPPERPDPDKGSGGKK